MRWTERCKVGQRRQKREDDLPNRGGRIGAGGITFYRLLAAVLALTTAGSLSAQGPAHSRYVAPVGASSNPGTSDAPWTLAFAVSGAGGRIEPGDTIWIGGGTYRGEFIITVGGGEGKPVIVRAVPGSRATIEGNVAILGDGYVWLWGLEIRGTSPKPTGTMGVNVRAPGVRLINLVVHEAGMSGIGHWMEGPDGEVYGSLIYRNGTHGRLDHGIYAQNVTGTKRLEDNLIWENSGYGIHLYTASDQHVRDVTVRGNIAWSNGGSSPRPDYFVGGITPASGIVIDTNASWSANRKLVTADLGWDHAVNRDLTYRGNYLVGTVTLLPSQWTSVSESGNILVGSATPSNTVAVVRKNRYESGRANVGVWNWTKARFVRIDVQGITSWQLKDAKDFFGPPVATGTGGAVTVPMNGAEFRAFVLLPR
jgi:Right handed beta helix region